MRLVAIVVALVSFGCLTKRGGGAVFPPIQAAYGVGMAAGKTSVVGPTQDVLVGAHWASLAWQPARFDVGLGYVGSERDVTAPSAPIAHGGPVAAPSLEALTLNGAYFELSYALVGRAHWRAWLSVREEALDGSLGGQSFGAMGTAARLSVELFSRHLAISDHGSRGTAVVGSFALGGYVEAAHRDLPDALGPNTISAGITLRLPFLATYAGW